MKMKVIDKLIKTQMHVIIGVLMVWFGVMLYMFPAFAFAGALVEISEQGAELYAISHMIMGALLIQKKPETVREGFVKLLPLYGHLFFNMVRGPAYGYWQYTTVIPLFLLYAVFMSWWLVKSVNEVVVVPVESGGE